MKTIDEILARNVKRRRVALRLSQTELADQAKVSLQTIFRLEKAQQAPRKANLEAIAKVLGCSREELYESGEVAQEKPAPTVSSLLDAMRLMQSELDEIKSSPLYEVLTSADELLARELSDLAKAYIAATGPERMACFQILHPTFGDDLEVPLLEAEQSQTQTKKKSR